MASLRVWLSQQRRELIHGHAKRHLSDGEEVIHWVRARRVEGRGDGFVYLTHRRCVVVWPNNDEDDCASAWENVETWGVVAEASGGPILGFESQGRRCFAQIRAMTDAQAEDAMTFVQHFADLAPPAEREFSGSPELGSWQTDPARPVERARRSISQQTRRMIVTIIGVALTITAVIIIPLPGPWSFVLALGALALLSSEYDWAQDLLAWTKERFDRAKAKVAERRAKRRRRSDADVS